MTGRSSRAPAIRCLPRVGIDTAGGAAAIVLLLWSALAGQMEARKLEDGGSVAHTGAGARAQAGGLAGPELLIGAYGGSPYTYDSDVRIRRTGPGPARDITIEGVAWQGQPFRHPLYYGARVARWGSGGGFGGMVDFVHSKTIADMAQEVRLKGTLDGQPVPERARIGDLFSKLEFSHGHNMLLFTGLMRLGSLGPAIRPYVGAGGGPGLPHTEIHVKRHDNARTYEYQYTGPAAQALAGVEIRLPRVSVFVEYKFTFAVYTTPLTGREGTWLGEDLWTGLLRWQRDDRAPGGFAATRLVSHQLIGGVGVRAALGPASR